MSKLKTALSAVVVAALSAGSGAALVYETPAIKCSTARHLSQCEECQVLTTNVVIGTIEAAKKQQASVAPVGS